MFVCDSWGFVCCCVTAGGLCVCYVTAGVCVFVFVLQASFKKYIHIFINLLYMICYLNCTVTSHDFVVLLKQTTEVKTLPIANDKQSHKRRPALSQSVSYSRVSGSRTDHST